MGSKCGTGLPYHYSRVLDARHTKRVIFSNCNCLFAFCSDSEVVMPCVRKGPPLGEFKRPCGRVPQRGCDNARHRHRPWWSRQRHGHRHYSLSRSIALALGSASGSGSNNVRFTITQLSRHVVIWSRSSVSCADLARWSSVSCADPTVQPTDCTHDDRGSRVHSGLHVTVFAL